VCTWCSPYHIGPCLVSDATEQLPHETGCEEGSEEGVGAQIWLISIESSFYRTELAFNDLTQRSEGLDGGTVISKVILRYDA
jgi:hypothetical protein